MKTKYIKTKEQGIIVFPASMQHSDFKHLNPVSAGFIYFLTNKNGNPACKCVGESESLKLKSDPQDTEIAMRQIVGYDPWMVEENLK